MKSSVFVYDRMRKHLTNVHQKYGYPQCYIIADQLLSALQVSLFFSDTELKCTDIDLIRKLQNKKKLFDRILFYLQNVMYGAFQFCALFQVFSRKKSGIDRIHMIYSLSPSQIKSHCEIRDFISDPRFGFNVDFQDLLLIENRDLKQSKVRNTLIVKDSMYWLYSHKLILRVKFVVILRVLRTIISSLLSNRIYEIIFMKQLVIDKIIFDALLASEIELNLISTQSQLQKLPSIFYYAQEHGIARSMLWYSDNSWIFEDSSSALHFDNSRYLRDFIDQHFCWSSEWCNHLRAIGVQGEVIQSGSILFYRNKMQTNREFKAFDVLIFDVTPHALGAEYNFYTESALFEFYSDISNVISLMSLNQSGLRIGIKNKRIRNSNLLPWAQSNGAVLIEPNVDLYELIHSARLVIGIPLVSPLFIARELKIPAAYYYSNVDNKWNFPNSHSGNPIICNRKDLHAWIAAQLRD